MVHQTTQLENVLLKNIIPDPNQPRKFFDQDAQNELTDSIREKGVIQPIVIRPAKTAGLYMIVVGERRYRSSVTVQAAYKDRNSIPAVIRDISDEEALELQIIENLQRKDVHPMEEAVSFKSIMDTKQWTVAEIAGRVGKFEAFIRQRLKLNELITDFQTLFFHNNISYKHALRIATMPSDQQELLFNDTFQGRQFEKNVIYKFNEYTFNRYNGAISSATFDIDDTTLDQKSGACSNCPFNTAVANLFPDDVEEAHCTNVKCFSNKTQLAFEKNLKIAKEDPLISLAYYGTETDLVKQLKKEGCTILKRYHDFDNVINAPELSTWEVFKDEYWELDNDATADEIENHTIDLQGQYEKVQLSYEKGIENYNKKINSGKYHKIFWVHDHWNTGKFSFVELNQQKKSIMKTAVNNPTAVTSNDIKAEIDRIKDREKRSVELDAEKVHKLIVEDLKKHPFFKNLSSAEYNNVTMQKLLCFLLVETAGYSSGKAIKKALKIEDSGWGYQNEKDLRTYYDSFTSIDSTGLAFIVANVLLEKYSANGHTAAGFSLRLLAEAIGGIDIAGYEEKQRVVADKRKARVNGRIKELQDLMPVPQKKQPTKKPVKEKV